MDNDLEKIKRLWSKLTPLETIYILAIAYLFLLKEKISLTRPVQIIIPICILQIIFFSFLIGNEIENIIEVFAIGNFIIVGIALIPMTISKRKYHWIK